MDERLEVNRKIVGKCITVNDHHIYGFAGLTMDYNPLHVDEERARRSRFKGRIAHGLLSLSLGIGLISESISGYFLYGFDKIRFLSPVRPGDSVCSEMVVNEVKDKGDFLLYYCELTLRKNDSPLLLAEAIIGEEKKKHDDS
jgi:acyl dehydratase